jgi:hypothetical protein
MQNNSQKELFSKALLDIKENVTREDRINCAKEINRALRTVNDYVNGHVHDITTASKVLKFLKKEIAKRRKSLI